VYAQFPAASPIVQKYGGTSVGNPERIRSVAARIARQHKAGHTKLAVVVSAQSGETNRLVDLVNQVNPRASGISYDMALAAGEQVSVALMAAALEGEGLKAAPLLAYKLGIRTDELHSKARILSIDTSAIEAAWAEGAVAVIAGFQGVTPQGEISTLGRGGSDTSAVALAVAVKAAFCEINTDVDGVFTADPRIVPDARLIDRLDYEVALEMASLGSKVLHPRCVELGAKWKMPIVVRNTFTADDHQRTCIMPQTENAAIEALVVSGVTLDRDVARITLAGLRKDSSVISEVFDTLAHHGVNVDIIVHDKPAGDASMRVGFTVAKSDLDTTRRAVDALVKAKGYGDLTLAAETDLSKVSVVGVGMRSYAGVAGRTFTALTSQDIDIHMISTSEIKISVVVSSREADRATRALHAEFVKKAKA
jgi:aspartate kinase